MELNGALSNPLTPEKDLQIRSVLDARRELLGREGSKSADASNPDEMRQGAILTTITRVLGLAEEPLRASVVRRRVEELLGRQISSSTVNAALAVHSSGSAALFVRTAFGVYALRR